MYIEHIDTLPDDGIAAYDRDHAIIMTAMTFDDAGEPVDYFKQVFAAFDIASSLRDRGIDTEVQLLVADDFVQLNQSAKQDGLTRQQIEELSGRRQRILDTLAERYCEVPTQVFSTEEFHDSVYDQIFDALGDLVGDDPIVRRMLLQSVPERHRDSKKTARQNTRYTRGELATIFRSGADIKTGPARERLYDAAARDSSVRAVVDDPGPELIGGYVSETFPTAVSDELFNSLRTEGGLLPYKAKADRINPTRNRILLSDSRAQLEQKLNQAPTPLIEDIKKMVSFMTGQYMNDLSTLSTVFDRELAAIRSTLDDDQSKSERAVSPSD